MSYRKFKNYMNRELAAFRKIAKANNAPAFATITKAQIMSAFRRGAARVRAV